MSAVCSKLAIKWLFSFRSLLPRGKVLVYSQQSRHQMRVDPRRSEVFNADFEHLFISKVQEKKIGN